MGSNTRYRDDQIQVRVTANEKAAIREEANRYSLSAATYLRNLGLGFAPKNTMDKQAIDRLAKLRGDLGRIGGLLKLILPISPPTEHQEIRKLLSQLAETKEKIRETVERL